MPRTLTVVSEQMPGVILYEAQEPHEASIVDALNNAYRSLVEYGVQGPDWELRRDTHGVLRVVYGCSLPASRQRTFLVRWAPARDKS